MKWWIPGIWTLILWIDSLHPLPQTPGSLFTLPKGRRKMNKHYLDNIGIWERKPPVHGEKIIMLISHVTSLHYRYTWLLLQNEVAQSCLTLCNPMDCSPPSSSIHGILQAKYWSGLPFPSPGYLPNPGIQPRSPALRADALTSDSCLEEYYGSHMALSISKLLLLNYSSSGPLSLLLSPSITLLFPISCCLVCFTSITYKSSSNSFDHDF